ncbi:MAG: class IV adenylate cyclase [Candidatus Aenigmarchaeota archaeon]|nr:class IV adenylate cyclase [Candidatus Aenigmarchaeota archaeon]
MSKEIEMKAELENPEELRKKLKEVGAKFLGKKRVVDIFFDFPDKRFEKEDKYLRLRKNGEKIILEFKGSKEEGKTKIREETKTEIKDFVEIVKILNFLGLDIIFRYEKNRETHYLDSAEIVIDELPKIGWFCEIEAENEDIIRQIGKKLEIKNLNNRSYRYYIEKYNKNIKELVF